MDSSRIIIKNMVCPRCIATVRDIFMKCGVVPVDVRLGVVSLSSPLTEERQGLIRRRLEDAGFEMLDDSRMKYVEQIRVGVIEYVRSLETQEKVRLSDYLQDKCHREYSALSKLFTEVRGMTVERFCILQKVELAKELLFYGELTVSEIADRLHYSSTAHLSSQFKDVTGMSPSQFRKMRDGRLTSIDQI